jgi:uncharacterized protein
MRAQIPPPMPPSDAYRERDVRYRSGDLTLAATMFVPTAGGHHPAIALVPGSERATRQFAGYRAWGAYFASLGVVTLVSDKRGVGDSQGTYEETPDLAVRAGDVLAAVAFLRSQPEVDAARVGAMGHSQGGWIAPLAASRSSDIAFVIIVSGPGVSVRDQVLFQRGQELLDRGFAASEVAEVTAFRRRLYTYYATGDGFAAVSAAWDSARARPWFDALQFGRTYERLWPPGALADSAFAFFRNITYDPDTVLDRVRAPVLAVFGAADRHLPVPESVARMRAAFARGGNDDVTLTVIPAAGHSLQSIPPGEKEYLGVGPRPPDVGHATAAPRFHAAITRWLRAHGISRR